MKKFNFLENLLRRKFAMSGMRGTSGLRADAVNPDSQPTVNRQSRLTSQQRHNSVSGARVAREWLKYAAMFVMLVTIGVGNAWGAITNNNDGTYTEPSGTGSHSSNTITWAFAGGNITVVQTATGGTNPSSSYTSAARVYRYNTLTVSASNGFKIEKVEIVCSSTYYGNSIAAGTSVTNNVVGTTSAVTADVTYTSGHTHSFTPATTGAKSLFYIRNVNSGSTNTQLRWASGGLKVTYSYTAPTAVTEGTVTSSSFGLSITDALNTNKYDVYFSTSSTDPTATTSATVANQTTQTPTISSGVSAGQNYYVWVRSVKTVSSTTWKSLWTAMTGNPLSTPSAGTSVSYSKAATTNGSFTLSPASSVTTTSSAQTVTVTCTPDAGYYVSAISATNPATCPSAITYGGSNNSRTVIYPTGANGESTISVTFSPIWYLKGDFNSWDTSDPLTNITSNVATVTKSLSKTTGYEFKVYNAQEDAWYGNNGKIIDDVSGWTFSTSEGNCKVFATVADDYTFKYNISTKAMQVEYPDMTHPNDAYVYLTKWWDCFVHYWNTDGEGDHALVDWGYDLQLSRYEEICETDYWCVPILDGYPKLIMKDNAGDAGNSTGDQTTDSNAGKYITHNGSAWVWNTFGTYTITFAGNGNTGGSMSNVTGICPNGSTTLAANGYTKTGYTFSGWKTNVAVTANGSPVAANGIVPAGATISSINSNITLTAQWSANVYTVTSTLSNCTSDPAIPSSYTYTGSAANVTYTISPSSGYRLPTSVTVSGSTYTWDSGTGKLKLTGTITSNVSITITAVQTHNISWYVGGTAEGNKLTTGSQTTVVDHGGSITTLPSEPSGSACDKTFVGWTNTSSYTHGTSPLYSHNTASFPAINVDASFYAVFATVTDYGYVKYSGVLSEGDYVLVYNTTGYALKNTVTSNRLNTESPTIEDDAISNPAAGIIWHIAANGDYWTIYNENVSKYAGGTSTKNQGGLLDDVTDYAKWSCSSTAESTTYDFINKGRAEGGSDTGNKYLRNNVTGNPATNYGFACYASGTGGALTLYKHTITSTGYTLTCESCDAVELDIASVAHCTMTVKRSGTALADGDEVPTCAEQTLKVKVTPDAANHYRMTAMTISGVDGISVSPSTSSGMPTASEVEYTVTIPADASGTLVISPTIAAIPTKTVVFKTNGESSGVSNQTVYVGEAPTMPDALDAAVACDDDYDTFYGWTQATWSGTKVPSELAELTGSDEVFLPGASGVTITDSDPATITYNAVWADGTATTTYTKLTSNSFSTSATYVISDGTNYFNSCTNTDQNNTWGYCTTDPASDAPIYFKLSGTAGQLVVKSTEGTARYLKPLTANNFQMSASEQKDSLTSGGEIYNPGTGYRLRYNSSGLRWYNSTTGSAAYFYAVGLEDDANYLTHCCTKYTITGASTSGTSVTGGTLTSTFNSVCADNDVKITATVSEGYRFDGWSITAGGSTVSRKAGSAETEGGNPIYVFTMPSANVTVSATITRVYSVTYAANSGTGTMTDANKYAAGATVTVKSNTFSRSGYNWSSWSYSPSVTVTNGKFTMPSSDVTITANWTAKPLVSISLSAASGTVYVDQYADFTVTYDPADYISPGYTLSATPIYVTKVAQAPANTLLRLKGGRGSGPGASITETQTETVTIQANGDNTKTASVTMTVNPLPRVHFVDLVHGKEFADVVATIAENALNANKTTKTSVDWTTPNYNDCETNHLHLVGWIREDWPALETYLNGGDQPSTSAITTAGNDGSGNAYYFEAGAAINVLTFNGVTFYAVWAKVE